MPSNIRAALELGNHYAANKQWHNAGDTFKNALLELYGRVRPDAQLPPLDGLEEALTAMAGGAVAMDKAPPALKELRDAQAQAHPGLGLESAPFMSAFRVTRVRHWTIVYHDQQEISAGNIAITLPAGAPVALVLDIVSVDVMSNGPRSVPLSAATSAQIAYALSHLACAGVAIAIQLYTTGGVLISDGVPAILKEAEHYRQALLLQPDSPWALSHYGETYRNIANGWPPSVKHMTVPDSRVEDYIRALLYFEEAIQRNPRDFWAHAHLGAAVVNVRAFTGVTHDIPPLQGLLERWFPKVEAGKRDAALLDKAWASLSEAQRLRGDFYPWAQLYAADVLLLQSVTLKDPAHATEAARLGLVMTLDAMFLEPEMAAELFEPAELYDNAYYQVGLLALWNGDHRLAWKYVCFGLSRTFKFHFIPGLQSFLGYQLLANIAAANIESRTNDAPAGEERAPSPIDGYLVGDPSRAPHPLPALIDRPDDLLQLISGVFGNVCVPMVDPYLDPGVALDTNISVSLMQVCFVLVNFRSILATVGAAATLAGELSNEMTAYIDRILARVGLRMEDPSSYPHHRADLAAQVFTGKGSYRMAGMLKVAQ
jgi:tetratricopeptide (TPR) repeat protein